MKYPHIVAAVHATPWMITEEKLREICAFVEFKANGGTVTAEELAMIREEKREPYLVEMAEATDDTPAGDGIVIPISDLTVSVAMDGNGVVTMGDIKVADPSSASRSRAGAIAVLPVHGSIVHRAGMMSEISGGTSAERLAGWLRAALADPQIKSIVMDVDSPGGTVTGIQELADEIYKARQQKPIIAVANGSAASAAYYLASQASELVVTPSGEVGSIGVFAAHEDVSQAVENAGVRVSFIKAGKYKTEANPYEPLSSEARDAMQAKVDEYYGQFLSAVARGRGVTKSQAESNFGQGRMVMAKDAVKAGMADRVATFDQTLARLGARTKARLLPNEFHREAAAANLWSGPAALYVAPNVAEWTTTTTPSLQISDTTVILDPTPVVLSDLERRRKELDLI